MDEIKTCVKANMPWGYVISALLLNTILLSLVISGNFVYQTNDDESMLLIVSGQLTGIPLPFVIYSSYIWGIILSGLYHFTDAIEWYTVLLFASHLLAYNIILFFVNKQKIPLWAKLPSVLAVFLTGVWLTNSFQFTTVAQELAVASISCLFITSHSRRFIYAFLLFFLAANIRLEASVLPYCLFAPILLLPVNFSSKVYRHKMIFFFALMLSVMCLKMVNRIAYSSPEMKFYFSYNSAREKINDNPLRLEAASLFQGVKKQEYEMLADYEPYDASLLTVDDLRMGATYLDRHIWDSIKKGFPLYVKVYKRWLAILVLYFMFSGFLIATSHTIKKQKLLNITILILSLLAFGVILLYCMSRSVPKDRVCIPLIWLILVVFFIFLYKFQEKKWHVCVISGLLIISFYQISIKGFYTFRENAYLLKCTEDVDQLIATMESAHVIIPYAIPTKRNPFRISKTLWAEKYFNHGWTVNYPEIRGGRETFCHSCLSILEDNISFIYSPTCESEVFRLKDHLHDYYGKNVSIVVDKTIHEYSLARIIENE